MAVKKPQLPRGLIEHSEDEIIKKIIEWTQQEAKQLDVFIADLLNTVNIPVVTAAPIDSPEHPPLMKLMDDGGGTRRLYCYYEGAWSYADLAGGGAPATDAFGIITVSGQSNVVADVAQDTVEFVAGSDIIITTDAANDKVTFAVGGAMTHNHDERYFRENEFLNVSAGAGDAGKPIKLDADGHIDATMINDADIDHGGIGGLSDDDHPQYIKHSLATAANDFLVASGAGTFVKKTVAETGDILEGDINHTAIQNIGTNTHAQIDTHLASTANPHSVTATQVGKDTAQWNANKIQDKTLPVPGAGDDQKYLKYDHAGSQFVLASAGGDASVITIDDANFDKFLDEIDEGTDKLQDVLDLIDEQAIEVVESTTEPATTYPGLVWIHPTQSGVYQRSIIQDGDADTKVDVEESADEDIVRIDAGGSEVWTANANAEGEVLRSLQPAFHAYLSANKTLSTLDTYETIKFDTEVKDIGANYNTVNGVFVAPVSGFYFLHFSLRIDIDTAGGFYTFEIITTNEDSYVFHDCKWSIDSLYENFNNSMIVWLDANDQAYIRVKQQFGTLSTIAGGQQYTHFMGYLLG